VRLVLQEDGSAQPFCFAPLHGDFSRAKIPDGICRTLPASVVVLDAQNILLTRSAAIIYVMKRLGGLWYATAMVLEFVPKAFRDLGYAFIAAARRFTRVPATDSCPLIRFELRARFRD
jgi:predicted DCC family thiol-disulfide oxidoreductase YuxK